jgi:GNAT superfamily N-acetyltransferase
LQLVAISKQNQSIVATAHGVALHLERPVTALPQEGWDWAVKKSLEDFRENRPPNTICGLSVTVVPQMQKCGLGKQIVAYYIEVARRSGQRLIFPARPILKHLYPMQDMTEYCERRLISSNRRFDPWLRTHEALGGDIMHVCKKSVVISDTVKMWEQWAKREFFESGAYVIPGALVPVFIDVSADIGTYVEPNVWIAYSTK